MSVATTALMILMTKWAANTASATGEPLLGKTWKPPCAIAKELRKVPVMAYTHESNLQDAITAAERTAAMLNLYAATTQSDVETTALLSAAAAAIYEEADASGRQRSNFIKTALEATATTQELTGGIEASLQVFKSAKHSGGYCLADTDTDEDKTADIATAGCEQRPKTMKKTPSETLDGDIISATGFKAIDEITGTNGMATSVSTKCGLVNFAGAGTGAFVTGATGVNFGYGLFKIATTNRVTRTSQQNLKKQTNRDADDLLTLAFNDADTIRAAITQQLAHEPEAIIKAAVTTGKLKGHLTKLLHKLYGKQAGKQAEDKAEVLIKENFGEAGEKVKSFLNKLDEADAINVDPSATTNTKIKEINDAGILQVTLAFYKILEVKHKQQMADQVAKLQAQATEKQQDVKSAEQTCNDLKEKSDCDTNNRCTYDKTKEDGKKCTLSDEEKEAAQKEGGEKDSKTGNTNTTGSNSFIINKAPLLLAFLLF
uniref:Variant surface glycoprotein n=1 Tax=Trypanosoma brucei TaxID=5691 RepID=S5FWF1_9TRYP|nr:variant surface glycoprotein [Trypanosoma brucei]